MGGELYGGQDPTAVAGPTPDLQQAIHAFVGRADRWCEHCHKPDRDPIHAAVAGPTPNHQQAIHAAQEALRSQKGLIWSPAAIERQARLCVEAAWQVMAEQLQAAKDHAADLMWDLQQQLQAAQAEVDELREAAWAFLLQATGEAEDCSWGRANHAERRLRAALDLAAQRKDPQ